VRVIFGVLPAIAALSVPGTLLAMTFTNVTTQAGFNYSHGNTGGFNEARYSGGGAAVGDYDKDGWEDIYVVRGNVGANLLFRNLGNGTFFECAAAAGVSIANAEGCGPAFGDYDSDGWLDLIIGGTTNTPPRLFRNQGNGTFTEVTSQCGITASANTFSCAFADYDKDGDMDLFLAHWGPLGTTGHLWRNNGNGTFADADLDAGIEILGDEGGDYSYTGNFADIDDDGWLDLLVAVDFARSKVFLNDGDGTFTNATTAVISDENGMGSAIGDYDNDGDLDWFVSSIWDPNGVSEGNWGVSGNRLYRNNGGVFVDATTAAGVRQGWWGWGSSFADLNNDGRLDLVHTNGWITSEFERDSTRVFLSNGNGTFTERSYELGVRDVLQGRGISCFDYDRDGDLDLFIANYGAPPVFYRNDGGNALNWLDVQLAGPPGNTQGIGARVYVVSAAGSQMREMRGGSNYVSQDPVVAHFGLGSANVATLVRVDWPDGEVTILNGIAANQRLVIDQNGTAVAGGAVGAAGAAVSLAGAWPNPFPEGTKVRFALARAGSVTVSVYDLAGRLVANVLDEPRPAGEQDVTWDGRNGVGARVAPGRYVVSVATASGRAARPVTVLR
jgi:hypothetical protein